MSWFVREQVQACHFLCTLSAAVQFRTRLQMDVNEEFICLALLNFARFFFFGGGGRMVGRQKKG